MQHLAVELYLCCTFAAVMKYRFYFLFLFKFDYMHLCTFSNFFLILIVTECINYKVFL